ncbi:hypothetical protein AB0K05_44380, partial [Nonomuraea sp. NPDC049486]|uniref:hypothetical protein n=1 Tax=Nonomuraea sp. NPDC049486 TaxID=3155773 RepID=UPI0034248E6F
GSAAGASGHLGRSRAGRHAATPYMNDLLKHALSLSCGSKASNANTDYAQLAVISSKIGIHGSSP